MNKTTARTPTKMLPYPPIGLIRLGLLVMALPGVFELALGIGLLIDTENVSPITEWLIQNGLPPAVIGGAMIIGGVLFLLYQAFWRNHHDRDAIVSGILQTPLSFRLLIATIYSITFGTLTLYGFVLTWGLYAFLLITYLFAWWFDNWLHGLNMT